MSDEFTDEPPAPDFQTAFWSAKHALSVATSAAFSRHGVHEGQQFILRRLWEQDGLTPGEIARRLLGLADVTSVLRYCADNAVLRELAEQLPRVVLAPDLTLDLSVP